MDSVFSIEARWDEDMWVATSDNLIPGLAVDALDLNELRDILRVIVPELLEEEGPLLPSSAEDQIKDERLLTLFMIFHLK